MSAAGRTRSDGTKAAAPSHEFYPTPAYCVTRLLEHVQFPPGLWLEPTAGDGAIIRAVQSVRADVKFRAYEIRPEAAPHLLACAGVNFDIGDFLSSKLGHHKVADVAIGNPPFSLAAEVVRKSLEHALQVVLLLRLNWLGSSTSRRGIFEDCGVPDVYVMPDRPSFTGEGTDATEYAWMRWIRGRKQKSEVRILFEGGHRQTSAGGRA